MATYIINETSGPEFSGFPNKNVSVEAEEYQEVGAFIVFYDADGNDVYSMKTDKVDNIRRK